MHFTKQTKIILVVLIFFLSTYYFKQRQINDYLNSIYFTYIQKNKIKNKFDRAASRHDDHNHNLHYGSAWMYLTEEQFKEIILDGLSKMDPKISKNVKIFELGVGVGAALKVIEDNLGYTQLDIGGLDISTSAINTAKNVFPKQSDHFFVGDMTQRQNIPDDYYDHVLSFGALAMYLTKSEMKNAIKEAVRITKPGGSLLFTSFIAPGGKHVGSIVSPVETSFFEENAKEWGIENIKIYEMKNQGDRYQVTFKKQGRVDN